MRAGAYDLRKRRRESAPLQQRRPLNGKKRVALSARRVASSHSLRTLLRCSCLFPLFCLFSAAKTMPSRGRGRGAGRGGANDSANTLTLPFAAVVAGSPSPSPSPSPTPSFASPSTAPLPQTSSSAASLVAATLPQPSGSSSSGIGGGVPPLQPLPPLAPLPVPAAGAGGGVTLTADLSSPSRSMSGVGRGAIVSSGSIGAAPDQTKKGGG